MNDILEKLFERHIGLNLPTKDDFDSLEFTILGAFEYVDKKKWKVYIKSKKTHVFKAVVGNKIYKIAKWNNQYTISFTYLKNKKTHHINIELPVMYDKHRCKMLFDKIQVVSLKKINN